MNTKCLLPLAFFALFISNLFAQDPCTMPPPQPLVIDSLGIEPFGGQGCSSIHAYISGGTPPYTYFGTPDVVADVSTYIACSEGVHCIIATDISGCSVTSCFEYEADTTSFGISSIELTVSTICTGDCGVAYVIPYSSSSTPYTLQWSDGTTSNGGGFQYCSGGTYTVTATDTEGNVAVDSFEIIQFPEVFAEVTTTDVSCHGTWDGTIMVHGSGGVPPYVYSWYQDGTENQSIINVMPGQYYGYVTDANGCRSELALGIVNEPLLLEISIVNDDEGSATAFVAGGTPPYEFQWNDPNNQTTQTAINLDEEQYIVTVTDANGCTNTETIDLAVNIETPEYLSNFNILPNPSDGNFTIDLQFEVMQTATIQVFNTLGQQMYQLTDTQSHFTEIIDMQQAAAGTYFVVISTESGRVVRRVVLM